MPSPASDKKQVVVNRPLLAACGCDPDGPDGPTLSVLGPAYRLAALIDQAARETDAVLTPADWRAIADSANGCLDLLTPDPDALSGLPVLAVVRANLADRPDLGPKWGTDLAELDRKLELLTPLHGEAVRAAVKWWWDHAADGWHPETYGWWGPAFRRSAARNRGA